MRTAFILLCCLSNGKLLQSTYQPPSVTFDQSLWLKTYEIATSTIKRSMEGHCCIEWFGISQQHTHRSWINTAHTYPRSMETKCVLSSMDTNLLPRIRNTKGEGKRLPTLCSNQQMKSTANNLSFCQTATTKQH